MERTPIALVGCGGMGRRHVAGLALLARSAACPVDLLAVCDRLRQNADDLADEAAQHLGQRPGVFVDLDDMLTTVPEIKGVSVATETASHHVVATACLDRGLHVLCEKPLALTLRGCNSIIAAARRAGTVLSVAENYRRDPLNRLAHALIRDGAIGVPRLMVETLSSGGSSLVITPWRHQKTGGTVVLDVGVHHADILQYYLGTPVAGYGTARLFERYRYKADTAGPGGFYAKWAGSIPDVIEATGEDALCGLVHFDGDALGQLSLNLASHGLEMHARQVYGSAGSLAVPGDRLGQPLMLYYDDDGAVRGAEILDHAPSYRLSPLAAEFFGGERIWQYDLSFPAIDARLLALEYHEFGTCMQTGASPEVTGALGRQAVALIYALIEAGTLGRLVSIDEVERVQVDAYQREIDEQLALL